MASLAPIQANSLSGFFLAGQNETGQGEVQLYIEEFEMWESMLIQDSEALLCFQESIMPTSGFPALKFFVSSQGATEVKGYLLVAGGREYEKKSEELPLSLSSKVSLFSIALKKFETEWTLNAKLVFEDENGMEDSDYFPCNQWVST